MRIVVQPQVVVAGLPQRTLETRVHAARPVQVAGRIDDIDERELVADGLRRTVGARIVDGDDAKESTKEAALTLAAGVAAICCSTGRVGRDQVPGLVVTLYRSGKARDRSTFEAFRNFHGSFYRFVEPTSVTPWALQARPAT